MENLIKRMHSGEIPAKPILVISNRPGVKALERAANLNVPAKVIDHKQFASREDFDRALSAEIDATGADLICFAGFMRVLTPEFVNRYPRKLINIHPAYLPEFPGAHGIRDAFEAQAQSTGVTVHYVDSGVDTGPIILQKRVPILPGDTLEALETRVHAAEYEIYPQALCKVLGEKN